MKNLVNSVSLATRCRNDIEDRSRAEYRGILSDALSPSIYEWRQLSEDTKRELTWRRLQFDGLEVIDNDIYNFQLAISALFSRYVETSDVGAAEALNNLKNIVYAQMEPIFNKENQPIFFTGEA